MNRGWIITDDLAGLRPADWAICVRAEEVIIACCTAFLSFLFVLPLFAFLLPFVAAHKFGP